MAHDANDVADPLFEHDPHVLRRQEVGGPDLGDQGGRPDGRMAGERQFAGGGEYPHASGVDRAPRLEHENCLGQVELARDRLHAAVVQAFAVEDDGKRISRQRRLGEDVEREKAAGH